MLTGPSHRSHLKIATAMNHRNHGVTTVERDRTEGLVNAQSVKPGLKEVRQ